MHYRLTSWLAGAVVAASVAGNALAQARLFQAPGPCNRACLIETANAYLAALVAHDPSDVKLGADLKFVENAERKKVGEGLWTTASAVPTVFALHVPDPVSGQVGFIGMTEESGKPISSACGSRSRTARSRKPSTSSCAASTAMRSTISRHRAPGCSPRSRVRSGCRASSCSRSA